MQDDRADASSVSFFEQLYAVVVGLGLALAVQQVIDLHRTGIPVRFEHLPLFLAFLNFAFALAHASVRYLQLAYVQGEVGSLRRGRVMGDLILGVGHFLLLIALSLLITRPAAFAVAVIVLLVGRPARDLLFTLAGHHPMDFDRSVAVIHGVAIAVVAASLIAAAATAGDAETWVLRIGVAAASLVFGLGLYSFAFRFFFPSRS